MGGMELKDSNENIKVKGTLKTVKKKCTGRKKWRTAKVVPIVTEHQYHQ